MSDRPATVLDIHYRKPGDACSYVRLITIPDLDSEHILTIVPRRAMQTECPDCEHQLQRRHSHGFNIDDCDWCGGQWRDGERQEDPCDD